MHDNIAAFGDRVHQQQIEFARDNLPDDKFAGLTQGTQNTIGVLLATRARMRVDLTAKLSYALMLLESGCDDHLGEDAVKILRAFDLQGDVERLDQARRAAMARDAAPGDG
jgi:hypothetical protein